MTKNESDSASQPANGCYNCNGSSDSDSNDDDDDDEEEEDDDDDSGAAVLIGDAGGGLVGSWIERNRSFSDTKFLISPSQTSSLNKP